MATRDMSRWETSIAQVVSSEDEEEVIVRGHRLSDLIGKLSFSEMTFLMLQGTLPTPAQTRVLDALMVASMEHGIAPPSMVSRCFASYGTTIQAAIGGGILAFGDRMGGLGEQLARILSARLEAREGGAAAWNDDDLASEAAAVVAEAKNSGSRVPGYGIPLHGADPRAPAILAVARDEGVYGPYCRFATAIERALSEARGGRTVPMNVDGVSAAVALDLGFDWRATRMFLLTPRSVSMGAHFLEEQSQDTTWRHIPADQILYDPD